MTTTLAYLAAKGLADVLSTSIADLAGKVSPVTEPPTAETGYPAAAVLLESMSPRTAQDAEVFDDDGNTEIIDDGRAFVEAGHLQGRGRLWVAARTPAQRERLQTAIVRRFLDEELAPGRLTVTVANAEVDGFPTPGSWPVAFFLADSEWREELVFSERRWAFLAFTVDIPLLLLRNESWRVTEMTLALTAITGTDTPAAELALIDEDGLASAP